MFLHIRNTDTKFPSSMFNTWIVLINIALMSVILFFGSVSMGLILRNDGM